MSDSVDPQLRHPSRSPRHALSQPTGADYGGDTSGREGGAVDRHVDTAAVVLDQAGMTYTVRSADNVATGRRRPWGQGASGVRTSTVEALKPLSLVVERGESVGVIGTNGSGKSTLMQLITGQLRPTHGSVYATTTPVMLGVNAALVRQVSGEDNIMLGCLAMGMSAEEAAAKRGSVVALAGLDEQSLQLPLKAYSSGMAARLQFAIATSVDPDILVIDEALNTGDAQFRERTRQRIDELREQAGCVFVVSHSMSTIQEMCSRAIWIERGVLTMDTEPEYAIRNYSRYVRLKAQGKDNEAQQVLDAERGVLRRTHVVWPGGNRPHDKVAP